MYTTSLDRDLTENSSQTSRVEDQVVQIADMLNEIHVWFLDNLKDRTVVPPATPNGIIPVITSPLSRISFELRLQALPGSTICSHASVHPKWNEKRREAGHTERNRLFLCTCVPDPDGARSHQNALDAYERN